MFCLDSGSCAAQYSYICITPLIAITIDNLTQGLSQSQPKIAIIRISRLRVVPWSTITHPHLRPKSLTHARTVYNMTYRRYGNNYGMRCIQKDCFSRIVAPSRSPPSSCVPSLLTVREPIMLLALAQLLRVVYLVHMSCIFCFSFDAFITRAGNVTIARTILEQMRRW